MSITFCTIIIAHYVKISVYNNFANICSYYYSITITYLHLLYIITNTLKNKLK